MATFYGNDIRNFIDGTSFRDVIYGFGGDDVLYGNDGHDDIFGGTHDDLMSGGFGSDLLSGGSGWDDLFGNAGFDDLFGGSGDDRLLGGSGDDNLVGGSGQDMLTGGTGRDAFIFDFAAESQTGFFNRDVVTDFTADADVIDISGIDARSDGFSGNQAFSFGGRDTAFERRGEIRYQYVDTNGNGTNDATVISGNTDGDLAAEFQIELSGLRNLDRIDFIL